MHYDWGRKVFWGLLSEFQKMQLGFKANLSTSNSYKKMTLRRETAACPGFSPESCHFTCFPMPRPADTPINISPTSTLRLMMAADKSRWLVWTAWNLSPNLLVANLHPTSPFASAPDKHIFPFPLTPKLLTSSSPSCSGSWPSNLTSFSHPWLIRDSSLTLQIW